MLVSRVYFILGINVFQINIDRKGKKNLASVSTIMTGTEEFTPIVDCIMGNQGKMTGNSKICIGIQSQLILPEFIYLPRSP